MNVELNGQEVPEATEQQKPGFVKRHKLALGIAAAVLTVGGIGAAVSGPEQEQAQEQAPKEEAAPTLEPTPEPEVVTPEPVAPETATPATPEPAPPVIVDPAPPVVPTEAVAADFDLPQSMDDSFVELVIELEPYAAYADPAAVVDVAMETCAYLANGGTPSEFYALATAVGAPDTGEHNTAFVTMNAGNGFYCPELG